MPKLKIYTSTGVVELPGRWHQRVNTQTSHIQGYVLVVAATKADAVELLVNGGAGDSEAKAIMRKTALRTDGYPVDVQSILDADAVDLDQPGAYAWRRAGDGNVIARVDDPALPIVGVFRRVERVENGRSTYRTDVEPFTEVQS